MIGWAGRWTRTSSTTPLQPKQWNAHFCITFNMWCWPDWSMDLNLIHHPSPAKNMKCSFLGYIQLLMISWAVRWTQTPSAIPLQPIKWNAHFWITFNFWWSAGLFNGLEPHPPPFSRQKNQMIIFWLCSTSDVGQTGQWTQTPSTTPLQPIKWNASFWIMFTSDDQPGWLMDSNPICHPSPDKKMKCSYFDYVQLLMIGQAGQWTRTPSTTPLWPKKMKCSFLDYVHFWWSAWMIDELEPHLPPLSTHKNKMLNFQLRSTSNDQPSWSIDSKSICQPSPANKMKCFFLDYVHFWWSARLVDGLEPHLPPISSQ